MANGGAASRGRTPKRSPSVREKRVASWLELIEELYDESWDQSLHRFRSPYAFRGLPDAACDLSTSLMRFGEGYRELANLEGYLLRAFRKYAHAEAIVGNSMWNWLALAQHHGLQTRLMDWTYSPFVAMHFATEDLSAYHLDGAIWCLNHRAAVNSLPPVLRRQANAAGLDVFTAEMLDRVAPTLAKFDKLARQDFLVFLEPPSLDARIVNQFALFSLISNPALGLDEWLAAHPGAGRKLIIPAELKQEIRDKLDQAGVTERMLYPGLDGLTRWLSRYYSPNLKHLTARTPMQRRGLGRVPPKLT